MKYAVAGIVLINNKILIGKKVVKKGHFVSGGWHIPGGHVNTYETDEAALIREYKEETGLEITIIKKLCTHLVKNSDTTVNWFLCTSSSTNAIPMDDLTEIKFVSKKNILNKCDKRAIERWPEEIINFFTN